MTSWYINKYKINSYFSCHYSNKENKTIKFNRKYTILKLPYFHLISCYIHLHPYLTKYINSYLHHKFVKFLCGKCLHFNCFDTFSIIYWLFCWLKILFRSFELLNKNLFVFYWILQFLGQSFCILKKNATINRYFNFLYLFSSLHRAFMNCK